MCCEAIEACRPFQADRLACVPQEIYGNEAAVGKALKESNVPREELFSELPWELGARDDLGLRAEP